MKHSKDANLLEHIIRSCDDVNMALEDYGGSRERFEESPAFRNACAMPLVQIGEAVKYLSEEALAGMPEIPWRNVKAMRDFFFSGGQHLNVQAMWETALEDIPMLRKVCHEYIKTRMNREVNP